MRLKKKEEWVPSDNLTLEDNALIATKSNYNTLVVAGPGAGKTELLAQRTSFLLETNDCVYPKKILAISFKKDAAYNLRKRVEKRCGEELSKRFNSLTFDAFSKMILDQFYRGLPAEYKVSFPYDVILSDYEILDLYKFMDLHFYNTISKSDLVNFHHEILPIETTTKENKLKIQVWQNLLKSPDSKLSFKMIMRLSQLIIKSNPRIKKFLQETYSHVFLDEFQDTTSLQFDFLNSCFGDCNSVFTAVGDDKQRIMLWAGARPDIFNAFILKYKAKELNLEMNFRSAPRLIKLQNHLIAKLLNKTDFVKPSNNWKDSEGSAIVWVFENQQKEIKHLFSQVKSWIEKENIPPRDICIIVKQQLKVYAGDIIKYFNANGIKARDENQLQDLLSDDLIKYILNSISLLSDKKNIEEKAQVLKFLMNTSSVFEDKEIIRLESNFNAHLKKLKDKENSTEELVNELVEFVSIDRIKVNFPNYRNKKYFDETLKSLSSLLDKYLAESKNIFEAVDKLLGKDSIPVMTIHKSKGLEYDSIVFVGLEDAAFWSFEKQPDEDKCAFFVALSRAKKRVAFTFSKTRADKHGQVRNQAFKKIRVIFDELKNSGIVDFEKVNE